MTPQSNLLILAPINPQLEAELRELLESMNSSEGVVNPLNQLLPFGEFQQVHFARILILDDGTLNDIAIYGLPVVDYPKYLTVAVEFDGEPNVLLNELSRRAEAGLRRIFSYC